MALPPALQRRLKLPVICAPMFRVSGPELVIAACRAGVIGAFPTANCRSPDELGEWLARIGAALGPDDAPFCPNLIVRHEGLSEQLQQLVRHRVEIVITSVGSPASAVAPLHDIGCLVFADVASLRHAHKAVQAGADGLVLLSAGAGGQTGWVNGFAFVRAVRQFFDGPVVMAGGMADGHAVWAARALGCDLAYMGTAFIATHESRAEARYKQMLVDAEFDDVVLSDAFTGLPANMLRPSIVASGLDPAALPAGLGAEGATMLYGSGDAAPRRWRDIWSAGHSVSGVRSVVSVDYRVTQTLAEYDEAKAATRALD
jgi:nitronate monooxygenase